MQPGLLGDPDVASKGSGTEHLARRMDFVRQVHGNVGENIRLADTKAGFVAAAAAALLNVVALRARAEASSVLASFDAQPVETAVRVALLVMTIGAAIATLLFAYFALRPRFSRGRSYIAFPELARMSPEEYLARVEAESDAGLIAELTRDTIALAGIAVRKNQMLGRGIRPLVAAAIGAALVLLVG